MDDPICCKNCGYVGAPNMMFRTTRPTPFCPVCGTSDVGKVYGS